MAELAPLRVYLEKQSANGVKRVLLTFSEIENIIGRSMIPDARKHFTNWDNRWGGRQDSWLKAGWRTVMVDMGCEKVEFLHD